MIARIVCIIPVALVVWWFADRLVRPDEYNWVIWIMTADASKTSKVVWGVICFAGTVAIAGCLAMFARRSMVAFLAVTGAAYLFANFIGAGYRSSGSPMEVHVFATLVLAMAASFPITFSSMIAGKQIDVVGE